MLVCLLLFLVCAVPCLRLTMPVVVAGQVPGGFFASPLKSFWRIADVLAIDCILEVVVGRYGDESALDYK